MTGDYDTDEDRSEEPERLHATDHRRTGDPVSGPGGEQVGRDTHLDLRGPWSDIGAN